MSIYRKMKLGPYPSLCTNNSNRIKNFNVKSETWKTTKGLQDIDIDKRFLNTTPVAQATASSIDKHNYMTLKSFWTANQWSTECQTAYRMSKKSLLAIFQNSVHVFVSLCVYVFIIQVTNNFKFLISLVIKKMQIKPTLQFHLLWVWVRTTISKSEEWQWMLSQLW